MESAFRSDAEEAGWLHCPCEADCDQGQEDDNRGRAENLGFRRVHLTAAIAAAAVINCARDVHQIDVIEVLNRHTAI